MDIKRVILQSTLATVVVITSGCASYRVSSNVDTLPAPTATSATPVLITETGLSDRKFKVLGPIDVSVKKLTVFHKDPTKEQANEPIFLSYPGAGRAEPRLCPRWAGRICATM